MKRITTSLTDQISDALARALSTAYPALTPQQISLAYESLENKKGVQFGDYSSNIAFRLAPILSLSPQIIASALRDILAQESLFSGVEHVQGFLNFSLTPSALITSFTRFNPTRAYTAGRARVIVEYSSPNVAKPFHLGHLRNTVLGEFLARLHTLAGHKVIRWNHLGDWGTQFGKLIVAYELWGSQKKLDARPIAEMLDLYVRFNREAKEDPSLDQRARDEFKKLEDGDKKNRELLNLFLKETLKELSRMYMQLETSFDVVKGESFYLSKKDELFKELAERNLLQTSEGARIIELDGMPPVLLEKSDGATLYHTRDLLSLRHRIQNYHPDQILYVVGSEQALHFKQLFEAARILGITGVHLEHISYGLVTSADHKKLSTREGDLITAQDVLEGAVTRARQIIDEKRPDLSPAKRSQIATLLGIGSVKYNLLKENRTSPVAFDYEKMLSFKGNSLPYLAYTCARLRSITKKTRPYFTDSSLLESKDIALIKELLSYPEALKTALSTSSPHHLADYLFKVSNVANTWYETTPILKDQNRRRRATRRKLISRIVATLEHGLTTLGISIPDEI